MIEHITPERVANSIVQDHKYKGTYLIVEGLKDNLLFNKFVANELCQIKIAFGNLNVIEVINELNKRSFKDVVGIIDSDFRVLNSEIPNNENIFLTDEHDIELMIFKSATFETLLLNYCQPEKIAPFRKLNKNKELRDILLNLAAPLGYLKWAHTIFDLGLIFKPQKPEGVPLPISDFIPVNTLEFAGYDKMLDVVINYSRNKSTKVTTKIIALKKVEEINQATVELYHLCNGHDVMSILSLGLRKKLSNLNSKAVSADQLENEFIFAYDSQYFAETRLYASIKKWEKQNNKTILSF